MSYLPRKYTITILTSLYVSLRILKRNGRERKERAITQKGKMGRQGEGAKRERIFPISALCCIFLPVGKATAQIRLPRCIPPDAANN